MNNLSNAASLTDNHQHLRRCGAGCCFGCNCEPIPAVLVYTLITLFVFIVAFAIFIIAVVHNPIFLLIILLFSSLIAGFLLWNCLNSRRNGALISYLHTLPDSDLRFASDGDIVKITGVVTCGSVSLESSYEKVDRCIYTSTKLYESGDIGLKPADVDVSCFQWRLAYAERFSTDFHITDSRSGIRALVKAGVGCKVTSLILENTLVKTTRNPKILSSHLTNWLRGRDLPTEARLLRLEEGYVKEGSHASIIGLLRKSSEAFTIVQLPELISTGCQWRKLLIPVDVDGLILGVPEVTNNGNYPNTL